MNSPRPTSNRNVRQRLLAHATRDSSTAKRFSSRALHRKLAKLEPPPEFELPLYDHQIVGFLLGLKYNSYFLQYDMGLGKSAVAVTLFRYRRKLGQAKRMLVLCRQVSQLPGWSDEVKKHAPELNVACVASPMSAAKRREVYANGPEVVVTTYAGFRALVGGKGKDPAKVLPWMAERIQFLVMDESTECANPKSQIWGYLDRLVDAIPYRLALTGTPWTHNPMGIWGQFQLVDRGETLGDNEWVFRTGFFKEVKVPFGRGKVWRFDKRTSEDLHTLMRHGSIRYNEDECLDLPDTVGGLADPMIRSCPMCPEQVEQIDTLLNSLKEAHEKDEIVSIYNDMRRVSSGYIQTAIGPHAFSKNPKLESLLAVIEECAGNKLIVFCHYRETVTLVRDRLIKEKFKVACIYGGTSNVQKELDAFKGPAQILVCNGAASFGLNLQHCSRTVFFERPPLIESQQAEKRTHRNGQKASTVFYWDLIVKGTLDRKVLLAQGEGKKMRDIVVDGAERL
jgi:SNF2 family DNA or RNA helicase